MSGQLRTGMCDIYRASTRLQQKVNQVTLKLFSISLVALMIAATSTVCWSQTHLKLVLKTSVPIDTAYVGHFTDKEFIRLPSSETLEFDFKINGADFYHINYLQKEKVYNQRLT